MKGKVNARVLTVSKGGLAGMREAHAQADRFLDATVLKEEASTIGRFKRLMEEDPGRLTFGRGEVDRAFEEGLVEELLTTDPAYAEEKAAGCKVHIVSGRTPESQVLVGIGGVAAILWYAMEV